jgi:hypothetical protein
MEEEFLGTVWAQSMKITCQQNQRVLWSELSLAPGSPDLTGGDGRCRRDKG